LPELDRQDREEPGMDLHPRPFTLPLFDPPLRIVGPRSNGRPPSPSAPRDLALHVYWSAGLEGHALGSLASEASDRDEERALRELQSLEYEVKEAAARLLGEVWQLKLPGAVGDESSEAELPA
jgi:hypothetical protein